MKNNTQRLMLGLILTICMLELPLVTLAQMKQAQSQPTPSTQPKKKRSTWEAILTLFKKRKNPPLGSRGICPVSPGILEDTNVIWSDHPLFLWQGISISVPVEIRLYSPFDPKQEQKMLWRQDLTKMMPESSFQGIQYTGEALQPGKIYDWEIFNLSNKSKERRSFRVMSLEERNLIAGELKSLEDQLRSEQATDEEIALERANYFAQRNLWSDALQEMSSVPTPSPELAQKVQELLSYLCEVPNTAKGEN